MKRTSSKCSSRTQHVFLKIIFSWNQVENSYITVVSWITSVWEARKMMYTKWPVYVVTFSTYRQDHHTPHIAVHVASWCQSQHCRAWPYTIDLANGKPQKSDCSAFTEKANKSPALATHCVFPFYFVSWGPALIAVIDWPDRTQRSAEHTDCAAESQSAAPCWMQRLGPCLSFQLILAN